MRGEGGVHPQDGLEEGASRGGGLEGEEAAEGDLAGVKETPAEDREEQGAK